LFSLYQKPPSLKGALVVGISQSGQSPDIVSVLEEGRKQGSPTLASPNPTRPFQTGLGYRYPGRRKSRSGYETYRRIDGGAMLSSAMLNKPEAHTLGQVPTGRQVLARKDIAQLAERYRYMGAAWS
jgi:glucosamine--fructose-6-phosphate aminotransferase (isomerizing)